MNTHPTIDVVIAACNESKYLRACLVALQQQEYPSSKINSIVVIDKDSVDKTVDIANIHAGSTILLDQKMPVGAMRNVGVKNGSANLVAFIDGHCIPAKTWAKGIASAFNTSLIGGVAGPINFKYDSVVTAGLARHSLYGDTKKFLDSTIDGRTSAFPWLATGNCVYRREILEALGGFNTELLGAEDLDLSWRVFLSGYLFGFAPTATVDHHDTSQWRRFLLKHFNQGRASRQLANLYGMHTRRSNTKEPSKRSWQSTLIHAVHKSGVRWQTLLEAVALANVSRPYDDMELQAKQRVPFVWENEIKALMPPTVFAWRTRDGAELFSVNTRTQERFEFTGSSALIFAAILEQQDRKFALNSLKAAYRIGEDLLSQDMDEFIDLLKMHGLINLA